MYRNQIYSRSKAGIDRKLPRRSESELFPFLDLSHLENRLDLPPFPHYQEPILEDVHESENNHHDVGNDRVDVDENDGILGEKGLESDLICFHRFLYLYLLKNCDLILYPRLIHLDED